MPKWLLIFTCIINEPEQNDYLHLPPSSMNLNKQNSIVSILNLFLKSYMNWKVKLVNFDPHGYGTDFILCMHYYSLWNSEWTLELWK